MIDVLMDGVYTFGALEELYQNFSRPGASIKVNGVNIVGVPGFKVTDITVSQTIFDKAGSASFKLVDCYDRVLHCFNKLIEEVMVLGTEVEVALGYSSVYLPVFKGYIAGISWNFDAENGASCSVTCMDARKLMMEDVIDKEYQGSYYSIMKSVVGPYEGLCSLDADLAIKSSGSPEGTLRPAPGQSIYHFIKEKLVKQGELKKEFFILGKKLYYRAARSKVMPIMSIGLGTGLLSFSRSADYLNQKIEVISYNQDGSKKVKVSKMATTSEKHTDLYTTTRTIIRPDISEDAAKNEAERVAEEQRAGKTEGSGSCVGMPQIVPGRYIRIKGLDDHVDGKQYITEATHRLSMSGYTTDITIGGE